MGLNSQAWRNSVEEKRRLGAWMRVWMPHLRTHVRASRGARRKGNKKLTGCSRAVGQMFKQTSNYLNSIWDLRGVPALESIALLLPPPSPIWILLSPLAFRLSLFFFRFWGPPPKMSSAELHVKSTRRAFHSLAVLSPSSPLCPADSDWQPFPSLSPRPSLSLSYSFFDHRHCATTGCVRDTNLL